MTNLLIGLALILWIISIVGMMLRRNMLAILMFSELMLNAIILLLVAFSREHASSDASILIFLIYIVAASEMALAVPIVFLMVRHKKTLDATHYSDLRG